jgi:hypothetical protein
MFVLSGPGASPAERPSFDEMTDDFADMRSDLDPRRL